MGGMLVCGRVSLVPRAAMPASPAASLVAWSNEFPRLVMLLWQSPAGLPSSQPAGLPVLQALTAAARLSWPRPCPSCPPRRRSNIELQRLDAVSRSPIYAHFSESLSGVETIRAYQMVQDFCLGRWAWTAAGRAARCLPVRGGLAAEESFWARAYRCGHPGPCHPALLAPHPRPLSVAPCLLQPSTPSRRPPRLIPPTHPPNPRPRSDSKVDANHRAYFTARMANEWLSMRLDCIGACVVLGTALLAIIRRDTLSASLAALTMSEALDVTMFLKAAVTSGATFESRFNAGGCCPGARAQSQVSCRQQPARRDR